jgi:FeS assembly SUF system protein
MEQITLSTIERDIIKAQVIEVLQTCFDPEIPVNIYELGLIYEVAVGETGMVDVKMTLTSPHCPAAQSLPPEVQNKVKTVPGVTDAKVVVVWEPTWTPALMSEAAKLELGMQ